MSYKEVTHTAIIKQSPLLWRTGTQNGATEEEILEALGVAVNVKAGSALIYSTRALNALKAKVEGTSQRDG